MKLRNVTWKQYGRSWMFHHELQQLGCVCSKNSGSCSSAGQQQDGELLQEHLEVLGGVFYSSNMQAGNHSISGGDAAFTLTCSSPFRHD